MSTNRRYQASRRSAGTRVVRSGPTANFGALPRVSRETNTSAWIERGRLVVGLQPVEHVRHRDEHGESGTPPGRAVRDAELESGPHDRLGLGTRGEQTEHRLRDHEREALLEAVAQPRLQQRDGIRLGPRRHDHVVAAELDVEAVRVVGPEVERAARLEVEPRVMPVTGHQSRLHRAAVQREPEVRAPVLDRPGPVRVPEHDHGEVADLREQLAGLAELGQRSRSHRSCWCPSSLPRDPPPPVPYPMFVHHPDLVK